MIRLLHNKRINNLLKSTAIFCLLIFFSFILLSSLFLHMHNLPDGRVIIHSHPIHSAKTPTPDNSTQHYHSVFEYLFYYNFSNSALLLFSVFLLIIAFFTINNVFKDRDVYLKLTLISSNISRAQPIT